MSTLLNHGTVREAVEAWLTECTEPGYTREGLLKDLLYGGCASGMVGELVYYTCTLAFEEAYRDEILRMVAEDMGELGAESLSDLFGAAWDTADPFARDTTNRNLLAWYAFEREAGAIADAEEVQA